MMDKFEFLLGMWHLKYNVPQSSHSEATTGTGTGTFKRALDDKYIWFDYESLIDGQTGQAHAVLVWDEKEKIYRYWWFESSGSYRQATCNFLDENTLFLNWHDTLLIQTFKKIDDNTVVLHMKYPNVNDGFDLILEVVMTRQ